MAVYYISAAGSDSNNGLSDVGAWLTVSKVNGASFAADDQILFRCGDMWREQLTVPSSGTSGHPITVGSYVGSNGIALPVLKGSDAVTGWSLTVPAATTYIDDNYTRGNQSGWGSAGSGADTNKAWTVDTTNLAIASNHGVMSKDFGSQFATIGDSHSTDVELYAEINASTTSQDNFGCGVESRFGGSSGYGVTYQRSNTTLYIRDVVGNTALSSSVIADPGAAYKIRSQTITNGDGSVTIKAKVWASGSGEPGSYQITYTDSTLKYTSGNFRMKMINSESGTDMYLTRFTAVNIPGSYVSTYQAAYTSDPGFIVAEDDTVLTKVASIALVESTAGSFYWSTNVLYVHTTDGTNPSSNGRTYAAAKRDHAIVVDGKSYVTLSRVEVAQTGANGVSCDDSTVSVIIDQCVGRQCNWQGLYVQGINATIQNSTAYQNKTYAGIGVYAASGGTTTVKNCTSYSNGTDWWQDHGYYVSHLSNSSTVFVQDCVAYSNFAHGYKLVASATSGRCVFLRNVSYLNGHAGYFADASSTKLEVYHCDSDGDHIGLMVYDATVTIVAAENNIFANATYDAVNDAGHTTTGRGIYNNGGAITACDYNLIYGNQVARTGQSAGAHDVTTDPLFASAATHNYAILTGSPAIGAGISVAGIDSSTPDIGAFPFSAGFAGMGRTRERIRVYA